MATIQFENTEIECELRALRRSAPRQAGLPPHSGGPGLRKCNGFGPDGPGAVEIDGPVSDQTSRERRRLNFPPHTPEDGLRLACQTRVQGDITVHKHDGFWGQHVEDE